MRPYYSDDHVRLFVGDALATLRSMPDESVQTCVTSPPYWGLRDYGTAEWEGGDPDCDHKPKAAPRSTRPTAGLTGGKATVDAGTVHRDCPCGAIRIDQQLGLEPTPEEYVANMVAVFREVRRVLREDGTLWLNLGDSYVSVPSGGMQGNGQMAGRRIAQVRDAKAKAAMGAPERPPSVEGLAPKNLVGIPWRVAFALQADGWYLRSDIIWAKPNPMPESVRDRPTKAHEYVFLLSKSGRYFYDADAIAEGAVKGDAGAGARNYVPGSANGRERLQQTTMDRTSRNRRTVWTITTKPYPEAHFATFPPELPELCIKAGSAPGDAVLDPFAGAGTTLLTAKNLNRQAVGIELNPEYADLICKRVAQQVLAL